MQRVSAREHRGALRTQGRGRSTLTHDALFYEDTDEYVELIRGFALEGFDEGEPVLIAVPEPRLDLLRLALVRADGAIKFADMREQGRNPGRIIPFIQAFLDEHAGRSVRFVGENFWPGRTRPETVETHRHEALIDEAFGDAPIHIVCPYGTNELDPMVIEDARRTHPTIVADGVRHVSECYVDPLLVYAAEERPLPEPSADPVRISLDCLAGFRRDVERHAPASLGARVTDLVVAANEAAVNTLVHADRDGTARLWCDGESVVVEVRDGGVIDDPLAGRYPPDPLDESGRGLWLMHQLCDLVEVRSGKEGTVVRLHMSLGPPRRL
jgi:anti-sigma regulatory factor (Ser/Thr protein kinase)